MARKKLSAKEAKRFFTETAFLRKHRIIESEIKKHTESFLAAIEAENALPLAARFPEYGINS